MFANPNSSFNVTPRDPVYGYQNRTFQEIFGANPLVSSLMTPIQRTIRQSIVHAKRNRNPQCIELCITLKHVETSDSLDSKLCELEEEGVGPGRSEDLRSLEVMAEDFWREMEHTVDPFETICFYITKGYLDKI